VTTTEPTESLSDHISARYRRARCWNPISAAGIDEVADLLDLRSARTLLDIGTGTGGVLCDWVARFGLTATGVDISAGFIRRASEEAAARGVVDRVRFEVADGRSPKLAERAHERVVLLGAAGGLGGFFAAVDLAARSTAPGGRFAVGDQLPAGRDHLERLDHPVVGVVRSTRSDWDRYYTDQWRAVHSWAAAEPDHPEVERRLAAVREHQLRYLAGEASDLDWGVLVFGKRA